VAVTTEHVDVTAGVLLAHNMLFSNNR